MTIDTQLRANVEAELAWEPSLDERGILVAAKGGVVTLAGHVPSLVAKWTAEKVTKGVAGVRAIANDIEVRPATLRSDDEIAKAATGVLKANISVPADDIKVIVRDGWVTLEGEVSFRYQKKAAENAVRSLRGIRGISNILSIKTHPTAADIRGKIHAAFQRHADIDADHVAVDILDGTVTLTGHVGSWHEREDAENAAWAAPGVTRVQNNLFLS